MAVHKLEIKKRLGKFLVQFGPTTALPAAVEYDEVDDIIADVRRQTADMDLEETNVIFRGHAYTSSGELEDAIENAPY